ncbi:hypothetical protein DITRI_Ditri02bG0055700 [Diplodiscus trichospermus]
MEAALCLGYGPLPSISFRMPSSTIATPASTKLYFEFNRSSISVSGVGFTNGRRCRHFYGPGPLALDRSNSSMPSGNEKGVAKVVGARAIGASLALACALSIIGCGCKMNLKSIACPQLPHFSQDFFPSDRKKMALESLLDVTVNLASKEGRKWWAVDLVPSASPPSWDSPPSTYEIKHQIKKEAVSKIKRGEPDKALDMLKNEYKKCESSHEPLTDNWPENESESGYNLRMAMVEILICQGKYEEALKFTRKQDLDRAKENLPNFDVRPILYKAILFTMSDRDKEAQELWEKFVNSQ